MRWMLLGWLRRPNRNTAGAVVAFLLSDGSAWIRGTNVPVDGGMHSNVLCQMHGL